jgi:peptidoglycan/LPS O-acetylase OafA/YrhL
VKRVPALDGLRGLAALAVVAGHTLYVYWLGPVAVDVFFALSGFLIGGILLDTVGDAGWWPRFLLRRVLRIWPLYFAVLLVIGLTDRWAVTPTQTPWWLLVTFTVNFSPLLGDFNWRPPVGVLWSVAIEEQAYLLLPILVRWCRPKLLPGAVFLLACLSACLRRQFGWGAWWYPPYAPGSLLLYWDHMTFARMDGILAGVLAAWAMRQRFRFPGHPLPWIAGLLLVANGPAPAAAALVLALAQGALPAVDRVLRLKPLLFLGRISYGVYLLHPFVVAASARVTSLHGIPLFGAVTAATLVLAYVSWTWFEAPIQRWGGSRLPARQGAVAA